MFEDRHVVGFVEEVSLLDEKDEAIKGFEKIKARIDSGATIGSIDKSFVEKIKPKEVGKKLVKSSHGVTRRVVVELKMKLANNIVSGNFTVIDRSHMTYPILVGQDVLLNEYIIDPKKGYKKK
ncbi:RimK/LysX family protein [Candidatus Woesearchaeota archaeon]|nr:RimK/LysX family protein [Candidatus Woesearchaeota archaeon]